MKFLNEKNQCNKQWKCTFFNSINNLKILQWKLIHILSHTYTMQMSIE